MALHAYDAVRDRPRVYGETEPIRCGICAAKTRKGKPYCKLHLREMPYVAALSAELEERFRDSAA